MKGKKLNLATWFLIGATLLFGGEKARADNSGNIKIWNTSDSTEGYVNGVHYPGYSEEPDDSGDRDKEFELNGLSNRCFEAYLDVNGTRLWDDYRPVDSNVPFRLKLVYKGNVTQGNEPDNWLEFEFPWGESYKFGNRPMTLQQEDANGVDLSNGLRCDVRAIVDNGGEIDLGKLPAGDYTPDTPYIHLRLDFDKLLADLDGRGIVNLKDYAILAKYWGKEGRSIADISGPNGVPDMKVDVYDLAKMAEQWLYTVEDQGLVSKVESVIKPIIYAREYMNSGAPQKLFYKNKESLEKAVA